MNMTATGIVILCVGLFMLGALMYDGTHNTVKTYKYELNFTIESVSSKYTMSKWSWLPLEAFEIEMAGSNIHVLILKDAVYDDRIFLYTVRDNNVFYTEFDTGVDTPFYRKLDIRECYFDDNVLYLKISTPLDINTQTALFVGGILWTAVGIGVVIGEILEKKKMRYHDAYL